MIHYNFPPVAQNNEEELVAPFSFKFAAVNAGLGLDIKKHRDEIINYKLCNQKRSLYIKKHGRKNSCGLCMVVCPYGEK